MKKLIFTTVFSFAILAANAQLKVYSGGKISVGSIGVTPNYLIDLVSGTGNDINVGAASTTNGYLLGTKYVLWNNNKAGCIYVGQGGTSSSNTGVNNTFVGFESGKVNSTGNRNHFSGTYAGYANTTGSYNTFDGYNTGAVNTTGNYNTNIGYNAGYYNTTNSYNSNLGNQAGYNTTGSLNTFIGSGAGFANTSGASNTALGSLAGDSYTTCSYSTFIGTQADASANNYTNATALGYAASATGSNLVRIGNSSVTSIGGYAAWSNISDARVKDNLQENVPGIDFIKLLRPVTYNFNVHVANEFTNNGQGIDFSDSLQCCPELPGMYDKEHIRYTGFIAQEVDEAAQQIGYEFSGIDKPEDESKLWGLRYSEFVVPLVKGMQEQQEKIEELEARINECCSAAPKSLNQEPENNNLQNNETGRTNATQVVELNYADNIILYQNIPNPFGEETTINYYLPQAVNIAKMVFYNDMGQSIKEVVLENKGNASVVLKTSELATGIYSYSLIVDGKAADTKKMLKSK